MGQGHVIFEHKDTQRQVSGHPTPQKQLASNITREEREKLEAKKKDEREIEEEKPLIERIAEKEQKALGKADEKESFVDKVEKVFDDNRDVLMRTKTVFPFDFFPDTIAIDPIKISIKKSIFFSSASIKSILIKDIMDTYVEEAPVFATLKIVTNKDKDHPLKIAPLKKEEAEKAMKIINGLVLGRSESPEVGKLETIR